MKKIILGSFLILLCSHAFSETVINTHTNSWKNIPVMVDENNKTYTTSDAFIIPEGNYYYSFSGYRCLNSKNNEINEKPIVLKSTNPKQNEIFCYKDNE